MNKKLTILLSSLTFLIFLIQSSKAIDISTCSVLDQAGASYYLTADIINSATSYCMNISANNIILDCQGHTIDGDGVATYGIYVNRSAATTTNITIKNCVLTDWATTNIYLYYANGNNLINITALSSSFYGLYLYYSNSNNLTNITANSNTYGLYFYYSNSSNLTNITANSNERGLSLYKSNYNTITSVSANSNTYGLVLSYSNSNNLTNITANSNAYGLYLSYSNSSNLTNSKIQNSTSYGIYLYSAESNLIYNNLLNNTANFGFGGTVYANNWNTTKQAGTNIMGGDYLGGNYWTNSTGNGFSDTCADTDNDGFCDSYYELNALNKDYLPLTVNQPPTLNNIWEFPTDPATYSSGATYRFNVTACDVDGASDLSTVLFEWSTNTTVTEYITHNTTCRNYTTTKTDLTVGTHNYKWYANDSASSWASLSDSYTVNKNTTGIIYSWSLNDTYININESIKISVNASRYDTVLAEIQSSGGKNNKTLTFDGVNYSVALTKSDLGDTQSNITLINITTLYFGGTNYTANSNSTTLQFDYARTSHSSSVSPTATFNSPGDAITFTAFYNETTTLSPITRNCTVLVSAVTYVMSYSEGKYTYQLNVGGWTPAVYGYQVDCFNNSYQTKQSTGIFEVKSGAAGGAGGGGGPVYQIITPAGVVTICGNMICEEGETTSICPQDCPPITQTTPFVRFEFFIILSALAVLGFYGMRKKRKKKSGGYRFKL